MRENMGDYAPCRPAGGADTPLAASGISDDIPGWVERATASWADGRIGDAEFIRALQFLVWQEAIVV